MPSDRDNLTNYLKIAKEIALQAGRLIFVPNFYRDKMIEVKDGDSTNLVTETDKSLEKFIKDRLMTEFPHHKFMGEEGSGVSEGELDDEMTVWIVDPVDGTTNFIQGLPFTVISIALVVQGEPVVGVIYCPITGELFEAAKNLGCFYNGSVLKTGNACSSLEQSLVITEFGFTGTEEFKLSDKLERCKKLAQIPVRGIRMLGSAAYNLCQIARGTGQIYYEQGIHAWDIAAGTVIVREAGGDVRSFDKKFKLNCRSIIATANASLTRQIITLFNL